jgi:hypothetical protein
VACVGLQVRVGVPPGAGPLDGGDGPLPGGGAAPVTGLEHGARGRPHPRGQRRLHLGGGRQAEDVRDVAGLAGHALHVLAGLGERDDRDEEQGEEAPPAALPVLPVAAARAAVERPLADRVVEDPKSPDEQHRSSLPVIPAGPVPAARGPGPPMMAQPVRWCYPPG